MPTPTTSSPIYSFGLTGSQVYDALLAGMKWGGKVGAGVTLTYSFPWADGSDAVFGGPNGTYSKLNEQNASAHFALNPTQQDAVRGAFQAWANVANIKTVEVADGASSVGDIRVAWTSATDTTSTGENSWGWAYYPSGSYPDGGDIWISNSSSAATDTDWAPGSYNYMSLIHELGHALGLQHPFEGKVKLDAAYDNGLYTVMAYDDPPNALYVDVTVQGNSASWASRKIQPDTPMVYDIAVMQYLYGANMSYHTGDDTYTFDPATPFFRTIWDAGGNDTISVANFTEGCDIDLRDGHYSSIVIPSDSTDGYIWQKAPPTATYDGTNNLAIAFDVVIENAIGGKGDDVLWGNGGNNHLQGNGGVNVLNGGDGIDSAIYTGKYSDYLYTSHGDFFTLIARDLSDDQADAVSNMERMVFKDVTVALNLNGLAEDALTAQYTALAQKFYVGYFGRPADPNGLANMVAQLKAAGAPTTADGIVLAYQTNAGIKQLVDSFGASAESAALYHGGNEDFVTAIYAHLLGRAPDQEGLHYWAGALDGGGLARGLAALSIMAGAESNTTTQGLKDGLLVANRITVAENFTAALNQPALVAKYAGEAAAGAARVLLDNVDQDTVVFNYESNVLDTIGRLPAQLVGVQSILHDGLTT
ncbi:Peptidase M10 serralysin C terminal [Duganella sp. CF402]|uniref:DUF4214 domain-containing protein n=1 Tax=unclassified Duganella TaxID=2636909 RepID=UPI0008C4E6D9|nr:MULTISPECIES: M10 family metallopeptidase C-terminal domain-containing protein [unclassified Duganella]RZT06118.1 peptidase M10/serralysin-like protein [Duganella sp. BK701]SEM75365.1 Peptidase M10 serralysin C terminal [Duganella sp. CF402]